MHDSLGRLLRIVRRGLILLVGVAVLIAGVMMVVLPGPAVVGLPALVSAGIRVDGRSGPRSMR